ncbi:transmembrane protein 41A-A-like [Acanthaster planci]|uniref:Transmembrane protein 41A-A-like n=1 Tax=Acanthaster planci TaxID=133434 RepID=A0A8B7ZE57_ACAPL|nr:transmembrane protein 41A-A-like [Acanthaster planci]
MAVVTAICTVGLAFAVATSWLYLLSINLPSLPENLHLQNESIELKFPTNLDDLTDMAEVLQDYKANHFGYVMLLFCSAYLYKQTFAIPGSVFMNLLGGALFGIWYAFPLCCVLTATGASLCYLLSHLCGRAVVMKYFSQRIQPLQKKVEDNLDSLFFFLLFLRLFPMSPNWFLNISSPIIGIPPLQFFLSVLIGLMPYNFICIQTGSILSSVTSLNEIVTTGVMLRLAGMALVALLPGLVFRKYKRRMKRD